MLRRFVTGAVLAVVLATPAGADNRSCPSGFLTPTSGQTATGPSVDTVTASHAAALTFEVADGAGSATVQIEMCCSPMQCTNPGGAWAPVQSGALTLTGGLFGVLSVVSPGCVYRSNVTACTACNVGVAFHCSAP
jgi:hypothetical protein